MSMMTSLTNNTDVTSESNVRNSAESIGKRTSRIWDYSSKKTLLREILSAPPMKLERAQHPLCGAQPVAPEYLQSCKPEDKKWGKRRMIHPKPSNIPCLVDIRGPQQSKDYNSQILKSALSILERLLTLMERSDF